MKRIEIDIDYCKGCALCIVVCPQEVLEVSTVRNAKGYLVPCAPLSENCTGCLQCEMTCPDLAITVIHDNGQKGVAHA